MAVLGVDYGSRKIGLAKSDDREKFALPLDVYWYSGLVDAVDHIKQLCVSEAITTVVVGAPVAMQQTARTNEQLQAAEVERFIQTLRQNLSVPVVPFDERLTTKMAQQLLRGQGAGLSDDAVAAMIILQGYLDTHQK